MSKTQKKNQQDPLKRLKYIGYCQSNSPPGEGMTINSLVDYAKFYLCLHAGRLLKDPIWNSYADEEILTEYFAHIYSKNEVMRKEFEASIDAGAELYGNDIYEWLDKKIVENQAEMKKKANELEDHISFKPEDVLGD